jgi:hypothetical protein
MNRAPMKKVEFIVSFIDLVLEAVDDLFEIGDGLSEFDPEAKFLSLVDENVAFESDQED